MKKEEKEKAVQLVKEFGKELAQKVVCEIINYLGVIEENETSDFAFGGSYNGDEYYKHWNEVKQEILKLNNENQTFEQAVKPLMKWLCENRHPHTTAIVTGNIAELVEGLESVNTNEFIVD
jgi:hypothetical protein